MRLSVFTAAFSLFSLAVAETLSTKSRWIVDSNGDRFKLRCANWAGHMEVRFPEGLQWATPESIASWLADNGYNCVRLTYSIDMANDPNTTLNDTLPIAQSEQKLTDADVQGLQAAIMEVNPWVTTSIDAYAHVIDALYAKGIVTVLDNHVSHASWCCSQSDGNGWWEEASGYSSANSRYFNATEWVTGLQAMADFASGRPGVVAMSLRNELRPDGSQDHGNTDWYTYVEMGAKAIHATNSDLLIMVGGTNYALDLGFVYSKMLDTSAFPNKMVWEGHAYAGDFSSNCGSMTTTLGDNYGFVLKQNEAYTGPFWLSEFGVGQTGGSNSGLSDGDYKFLTCLVQWLESNDADWAYWALQGSYYVRDGVVNSDEGYGLLTHGWNGTRNPEFGGLLGKIFNITQTP